MGAGYQFNHALGNRKLKGGAKQAPPLAPTHPEETRQADETEFLDRINKINRKRMGRGLDARLREYFRHPLLVAKR